MPVPALKSLASKSGKSLSQAEKAWEEAKILAQREKSKGPEAYWGTVTNITKNKLGISEAFVPGALKGTMAWAADAIIPKAKPHIALRFLGKAAKMAAGLLSHSFNIVMMASMVVPMLIPLVQGRSHEIKAVDNMTKDDFLNKAVEWFKKTPQGKREYDHILSRMEQLQSEFERAKATDDVATMEQLKKEIVKLNQESVGFANEALQAYQRETHSQVSEAKFLSGTMGLSEYVNEESASDTMDKIENKVKKSYEFLKEHPKLDAAVLTSLAIIGMMHGHNTMKQYSNKSKEDIVRHAKESMAKEATVQKPDFEGIKKAFKDIGVTSEKEHKIIDGALSDLHKSLIDSGNYKKQEFNVNVRTPQPRERSVKSKQTTAAGLEKEKQTARGSSTIPGSKISQVIGKEKGLSAEELVKLEKERKASQKDVKKKYSKYEPV